MSYTERPSLVGARLREYEILEVIGRGGMGSVYRARHVYLEQERAIKVIQSRLASDNTSVERFIREARTLTKLHHPNLVQLFEFGTLEEDLYFMAMELIRGESVLDRIQRCGRIAIPQAMSIVRQAALGLQSVHENGIVHRDISPDNLLLVAGEGNEEITKIIDFGIAKPLFETARGSTLTNLFAGKSEYCSPEQCGLLDEDEVIDRRADIYSLGVTFYQMLSGRLPFYASSPQGYLLKHTGEKPKPLSAHFLPGELPQSLERIVMKMLAKIRADRYSSMEDLIFDLDRVSLTDAFAPFEVEALRGAPSDGVDEWKPGDLFAHRYLVEKAIGGGGMGTVYKAMDTILGVPVALKILSRRIAGNEQMLARFKREVILARKVSHPNACRIFDIGEYKGAHYVSMQYLEGQSLQEILESSNRLTPQVALPILRQVALAIQEAHRAGVIHRDLKPQNILVDRSGKAYIIDFGISISGETQRVTQPGILIGTPQYMSPEQCEGREADARADIYSLGVLSYEVLTGQLPFDEPFRWNSLPARKPSEIVPDFLPALEPIVLKALAKDPADRYQTMDDWLRDLEPHVRSTTAVVEFQKTVFGRWRLAAAMVILIGLVFAVGNLRKSTPITVIPAAPKMVSVSINATPWARVSLKPARNQARLPIFTAEEMITPCILNLPAGKYILELSNGGISRSLTQNITVEAGKENSFVFSLPGFDVTGIARQMAEQP